MAEKKVLYRSKDGRFWKYNNYISSGAFKDVYRGRDNDKKRDIAWCEIPVQKLTSESEAKEKQKVMKEISMLQIITNPHVLQLFGFWEHTEVSGRKTIVLATELMTGGTLKQYGKCSSAVIRNWGRQILKGLDALHTHQPHPIIHRDMKCNNIFIDKTSGIVKIGDLGLAILKIRSTYSARKSDKGTPMYKAPEIKWSGYYNEQVDVYGFGMCLLELSTGEDPYKEYDGDGSRLVEDQMHDQKLVPLVLDDVADDVLKNLIKDCISVSQRERYTVKQLLSHEFFLAKFEVIVQERRSPNSKTALMKIQDESHNSTVVYHYDFERHTPQSVTKELISSGRLSESNCNAVIDALTEKIEVLSLLSKTSNGIGEMETDSGVTMDTRYSTDALDKTATTEEDQIQVDDGAKVNPGTRHSTTTEEGSGSIQLDNGVRVHQQPPSTQHHPPISNGKPDPNESGTLDSLPTLKAGEDFLETLKTPEASIDIKDSTPASSEICMESSNKQYDCWRKYGTNVLNLLGEANFPSAAGVLHGKSLISSDLYTNIVTPRPGLSQREQITLLFNIIERKLQDTHREFVQTTWKAFTNAVAKIDSRYKKIKTELESLVNEQLKSELEAFRSNKERLCLLLQASLTSLTDQLWSDSVITDDEKSQVMNKTFHYYQKWMRSIQEEIGKRIKEDPTVFYTVVETLKRVDGLKKAIDKYLTLQRET